MLMQPGYPDDFFIFLLYTWPLILFLIILAVGVAILSFIKGSKWTVEELHTIDRMEGEDDLYASETILVTNKRIVVPPHKEWRIDQLQLVKVEYEAAEYRIKLREKGGKHIHQLKSDNKDRIDAIAEAINKALGQ